MCPEGIRHPFANSLEKLLMKILISGASGLVGSALVPRLQQEGHEVHALVRRPASGNEIQWDPERGELNASALEGFDAVIHLAGENIASGRWNVIKKQRIRDSRIRGTRLLAEALASLERGPQVFMTASAVGYYGDRGATVMDEGSPAGSGFLASVCRQWEEATQSLVDKGVRTLRLRIGVVLSQQGGALAKMLPPFKMGIGGRFGNGHQYMSWIDLADLIEGIVFLLPKNEIDGIVNMVSPNPVTNAGFTKALGKALHRPTIFPMPAAVARLALGEMADEMLLASTRVQPSRLLAAGYSFQYPNLTEALQHQLHP